MNEDLQTLPLFAYGSLKVGECNDFMVAPFVSKRFEARVAGRLYMRPDGYPALEVFERVQEAIAPGPVGSLPELLLAPLPGDVDSVPGELLHLDSPQLRWPELDAFEGFEMGAPDSDYLRVLVPVYNESSRAWEWAWTYVAPDDSATLTKAPRIERWPPSSDDGSPAPYRPTRQPQGSEPT